MNVEAAAPIRVRGPKRVRGSAAGNVGELEHDVAPEKCGVAARCPNQPSRKNRTGPCPLRRSYLPPMQPERQSPPTELTVAGGPWRRVSANPIFGGSSPL